MCRMYGFRSSIRSSVHASLVAAENALMQQSLEHPDGWGVSYYYSGFPHLLRSDKQAWEDSLFREVTAVVSTRTLIAHIRRATTGQLSVLNCHPFQFGPWTFAHNGIVAGFDEDAGLRRRLLELVAPSLRAHILGKTDSEICFYLFLTFLSQQVSDVSAPWVSVQATLDSLMRMTDVVLEKAPEHDPEKPNRLCFLLTNGGLMVALRFRNTLLFSTHKSRCPERDVCAAFERKRCEMPVENGMVKHLIVTSERVAGNPNVWNEMDDGDYVALTPDMHLSRGSHGSLVTAPTRSCP